MVISVPSSDFSSFSFLMLVKMPEIKEKNYVNKIILGMTYKFSYPYNETRDN